jgi:hypothetical protein
MYNYVNRLKEEVYGHYQMCYVEINLNIYTNTKGPHEYNCINDHVRCSFLYELRECVELRSMNSMKDKEGGIKPLSSQILHFNSF